MTSTQKQANLKRQLYQRALFDSFTKLDPRQQIRNPVMFIVEVGSVLLTGLLGWTLIAGPVEGDSPAFMGAARRPLPALKRCPTAARQSVYLRCRWTDCSIHWHQAH